MPGRVLIIGLGDLGRRISRLIAGDRAVDELVVAGRDARAGETFAALLEAAVSRPVRFECVDASDHRCCAAALQRWHPDVVVQAACVVSPWTVAALGHRGVNEAGFGIQLPFQIVCIRTVMQAARATGFSGSVVNCSYPDATHPLLAAEGIAPTVGVGNVSIMQAWVEAALRQENAPVPLVRMVAHHAQTVSVLTRQPLPVPTTPWVLIGANGARRDELAYRGKAISWSVEVNVLTAAVAAPVVIALLPDECPIHVSVPGPLGLPGGYPVRVAPGGVTLDLPPSVTLEEAVAQNVRAGRRDGIAEITGGVAVWTEKAQACLADLGSDLAAPLGGSDASVRAIKLARVLGLSDRLVGGRA